jgi:hypothetical protein
MLGDPRKRQIDFQADLNIISHQAPSVKKKTVNMTKSASLKLSRNKISKELKDESKKLTKQLGKKLMHSFINVYADLLAEQGGMVAPAE